MGLDMYVYSVDSTKVGDAQVDYELTDNDNPTEIWYWRKFNNLHGWMHRLYNNKGGSDPEFNCTTVRLSLDDLTLLEEDAKRLDMPPTEGFFFGPQYKFTENERDGVLDFCQKAREEISCGNAVFYDPNW